MRILVLEDVPMDAALMEAQMRSTGYPFVSKVVSKEAEFRQSLSDFLPDLILSDCNLPSFNGLAALGIARELSRETPFIFVSGMIGEEGAIALLHEGATDLVLKNNLSRLGPAVARAMREKEQRAEIRNIVSALHETIETLRGTKQSFESKALGELREKLERLVETTPWW